MTATATAVAPAPSLASKLDSNIALAHKLFARSPAHRGLKDEVARGALPAMWRMLLIATLLSLISLAIIVPLTLVNFEQQVDADTNLTAFNATSASQRMEANKALLAVVPGGGAGLTYALVNVATIGLGGGSYRWAVREIGPSLGPAPPAGSCRR